MKTGKALGLVPCEVATDRIFEAKVVGPKEPNGARNIIYQGSREAAEWIVEALNARMVEEDFNYLVSVEHCERKSDVCYGKCKEPVKQRAATGTWYITMGHPGYNSENNNSDGYFSRKAALQAIKHFGSLG